MMITGIEASGAAQRANEVWDLGGYPVSATEELLGYETHHSHWHLTYQRPHGGIIMVPMKRPGIKKTLDVHAPVGDAVIRGSSEVRGRRTPLESVFLHIETDSKRTANLARLALHAAAGPRYAIANAVVTYDGGLTAPQDVDLVPWDGQASLWRSEPGITMGDPYLAHVANTYASGSREVPDPPLMGGRLAVSSVAQTLGSAYGDVAAVLSTVSEVPEEPAAILGRIAEAQGIEHDLFVHALSVTVSHPPLQAAGEILRFVAEPA